MLGRLHWTRLSPTRKARRGEADSQPPSNRSARARRLFATTKQSTFEEYRFCNRSLKSALQPALRLERKFKIQNSFKFIQIHSNSKFKIRNSKLQVQNSNSTSNSKFLKFQSPFQTQSLKCRSSRRTRAEGARDTPSGGGQSWRRESASPSLCLATAGPRAVLQLFPRR